MDLWWQNIWRGEGSCSEGHGEKYRMNDTSKDEMRKHPLYAKYPVHGVETIGAWEGYFENLDMYCGMAFDVKGV